VQKRTRSTPLDDVEAGIRSEHTVVQQLITLLMQKAVVTRAECEDLLRAIGKQARSK
jgi:hypothetical protein